MKYEITFSEMSEIFKAVAKIEDMFNNYNIAENAYETFSRDCDNMFERDGFLIGEILDKRISLRNNYEKIERNIFKIIKATAEKMQPNKYEYRDAQIIEICDRRRAFELRKAIYYIKNMAMEQTKYITME